MDKGFVLPDYRGGSIVNLMSSIARASGAKTQYPSLRALRPRELARSRNIVLVIIDGLGFAWLERHGKGSFLQRHLRSSMTSVFPSTTAAAMTAIYTGVAPQQHGLTGWFMHFRELGMVAAPLPLRTRSFGAAFTLDFSRLMATQSFASRIKRPAYAVMPIFARNSPYNAAATAGSKLVIIKTFANLAGNVERIAKRPGRKFVLAYWPEFDSLCHDHGVLSPKVVAHFKDLDKRLAALAAKLPKGTTMIVSADHGLINTAHVTRVEDHPRLKECLSLPLTGEARAAYCHVRSERAKDFERYVRRRLSASCELHRSSELVKRGLFGLGRANPELLHRIGDYTLLMRDGHLLLDEMLYDSKKDLLGRHGGLTRDEMLVPLILFSSDTQRDV